MEFTHTLKRDWVGPSGRQITADKTYSGDAQASVSQSIPDSETDFEVTFTLDVSAIQSIYIKSDQDLTLETNDGTTPTDTIDLKAGVPYIWHTGSYFTNLLTADITANIFLTNASGSAAKLEIEVVTDPTP